MIQNSIMEYRKKDKLTQEDLASKVNVSRQTIISIERGKFYPSLELGFKLARVFNIGIEELFQFGEN